MANESLKGQFDLRRTSNFCVGLRSALVQLGLRVTELALLACLTRPTLG
jgi:hypothetical protein